MTNIESRAALVIDTATLLGDVRDALLDRLRTMPKPWTVMSEAEQQELIDGCTRVATHLVTEATAIIAANGFPCVSGRLVKAQVKNGMQLQIDVSRHDPQRLTVIDSVDRPVFLVIATPDLFMGERGPARPDPKPTPEQPADAGDANVAKFKGR
jgi:hypothetical protein